jgi:AbrB family looped-hinge helix DNA binding protein
MIGITNHTFAGGTTMDRSDETCAWTVKIGEKGQFVIPKEAREMLDIHPGDTIIVLGDEKRGLAIPPKKMMKRYTSKLFGELSRDKREYE